MTTPWMDCWRWENHIGGVEHRWQGEFVSLFDACLLLRIEPRDLTALTRRGVLREITAPNRTRLIAVDALRAFAAERQRLCDVLDYVLASREEEA